MTTKSTSDDAPDGGYPLEARPVRFYAAMGALLLAEILCSLEQNMVLTAIPTIMREFKDPATTGWLITAFLLVQAGTAAIGARLGDIFGRRRVLIIVVAIGALGSLISAFGTSLEIVILGRAFQGTAGIILPLSYGIIRQIASPRRAALWISLLTGGYAAAAALGYVLGGVLTDAGNWPSIFLFTACLALVTIPPLWLLLPQTKGHKGSGRLDVVGGLLFAPAVASILFGITQASKWGWDSPRTVGFLGCGAAVLVFWAWYEARRDDPLIDVRLFRRPEIAVANICAALCAFGSMQLALVTMMILQQPVLAGVGLGVSATMAGLLKLPSNASSLLGAPIGGWIASKYGARWTVLLGGVVGAAAWGTLVVAHESVLQVVILSVICGCGNILLLVGLPNMVLESAPRDRSSEVTGLTTVVRGVFSAIGAQVVLILLSTYWILDPRSGARLPSETAYQLTFGVIALSSALVAIVTIATFRKARATPGQET